MRSVLLKASLVVAIGLLVGACGGGGGGGSSCDVLGAKAFVDKVTGGEQCDGGESPVVALLIGRADGTQSICSGTMISLTTVLSAGHCFDDAVTVQVFSQRRLLAEGGALRVHPNWLADPRAGNPYDISLLRISPPTNIGPVPMLFSDDASVGEKVTIFGYGQDENQRDAFDRIQRGEAPLKAGAMTIGAVSGGLIAAAFDATDTAICQGDSGGPVVQVKDGVSSLVGVTSFTIAGCRQGSISGFVSLQRADVLSFISEFAPDSVVR